MSRPSLSVLSVPARGMCSGCGTTSASVDNIQVRFPSGRVEHARICRQCRPAWLKEISRDATPSPARSDGETALSGRASSGNAR